MRQSTWRKRRMKRGLTVSEVANYLDIDYNRYMLIDRGIVKMPNKYIDKFNELINKSKGEKNINRLTREEIVNEWWNEMSTKVGRGRFKLNDKMYEFNIDTLSELDALLGYKNSGSVSNYLNKGQYVGFDIKNKLYSFFENELNIQPPKVKAEHTKPQRTIIQETTEYKALLDWYNNFDLKEWRKNHKMTNNQLSRSSKLATGTIYNIMSKEYETPTIGVMRKLKTFIENYDDAQNGIMTFGLKQVPIDEVPEDVKRIGQKLTEEVNDNMRLKDKLLEKYEHEIETLTAMIEQHEAMLFDLRKEKDFYEKIINDINED